MTDVVPIEETATADRLLSAVGMLRRHTRRSVGRPWPLADLTASQIELMRHIRRNPGTSVAEAAAELGLAANTVSTLVSRLAELRLIRRIPDPHDRRVARLTLTPSARRRVEAWHDRRAALVAEALQELDAADRRALDKALPALERLAERIKP